MVAIDYHPVVEAVVRGWRREIVGRGSGLGEEQLRDLIVRLTNLLEILAASREVHVLISGGLPDPRHGDSVYPG